MQSNKQLVESNHTLIAYLYQYYSPTLFMFLCRQVPTSEDAEDALLEVFQAVLESEMLPRLDANKQRTWLWMVAHHKATDHYRNTRHHPISSMGLEEVEEVLSDDETLAPEVAALHQEMYSMQ
jgi:DNA-directed RNA polymerase specialized sigma24 family protein